MKKQKVFKQVAQHLLTQDERCEGVKDGHDGCFYRHPEAALKCAIGCLISDEFYHEDLEAKDVTHDYVIEALQDSLKQTITSSDTSLLEDLQKIHDDVIEGDWGKELGKLAKKHFNKDLIDMKVIPLTSSS